MATVINTPGFYVTPQMDESGPSDIKEPLPSRATVFLNIFNSMTHLFLGAAACCGFIAGFITNRLTYRTHIYLCTTGFIIMMSLAVLTLSPYTSWTKGISYSHKKFIHGAMQVIGALLAITGSILILVNYQRAHGKVHHISGLCALACLCLNCLCGIVNMFSSKIPRIKKFIQIGHSLFGICTLLFAFFTLMSGFELILMYGYENNLLIFAVIMIVIAMIGVVTSAVITAVRRMCC